MKGKSLMHCLKCIINIDQPKTQTTTNEQEAMYKYLKTARRIAEIGVYEGFNTSQFALHSPSDALVYAIDPFLKGSLKISYGKIIAINHWKKKDINHKIKIMHGYSWHVDRLINEALDFIFIDGDHSYEGVTKDFELYNEKLSENGIIVFHDARIFPNGWTKPDWGPVQLIEKKIRGDKSWKIIEEVDSTVIIQKVAILTC
ncbi:class I SAM-dependent methyltransferase [Parafilimonas sp.]|uniref:class I SAM-dependent methyltransferase n=1 Tax=Parafilimonas sp. TaxID=1969739 RepID=UPI003F805AE9